MRASAASQRRQVAVDVGDDGDLDLSMDVCLLSCSAQAGAPGRVSSASRRSTRALMSSRIAAHALEVAVGRVVDLPVLVALARVDRAGIAAAHRDHRVGGARRPRRSAAWGTPCEMSIPTSAIALDDVRIDLLGRALPAERTCTRPSASWSSSAAAIWLRPALCTQTNSTSGTVLGDRSPRPGRARAAARARSRCTNSGTNVLQPRAARAPRATRPCSARPSRARTSRELLERLEPSLQVPARDQVDVEIAQSGWPWLATS